MARVAIAAIAASAASLAACMVSEPEPDACAPVERSAVVEGALTEASHCGLALDTPDPDTLAESDSLVTQIAAAAGGELRLVDVLDDLDRVARPGLTQGADGPSDVGFHWDAEDFEQDEWFNQGVTGSSDAFPDGRLDGRHVLLNAWFSEHLDPIRGTRVTVADITNLDDVRYTHILLAEPVVGPDFVALVQNDKSLHAGGIVWYGNLLYVSDTYRGLRVFDLDRIVPATATDDPDEVGLVDDAVHAFGMRYVALQVAFYPRDETIDVSDLSFLSLDRSTSPPSLLGGEFRGEDFLSRAVRYPFDPDSAWLLADESGQVRATAAYHLAQQRLQGALAYGDEWVLSATNGDDMAPLPGTLYRTQVDGTSEATTPWLIGPQDLYLDRAEDRVWTAAEYAGTRDVIGFPRTTP